jgi:hypothetical protein
MHSQARSAGFVIDVLEARQLFYAGDILVAARSDDGNTNQLRRYNQAGVVVDQGVIPGGNHDFQVDRNGDVQMWIDDQLFRHTGPVSDAATWQFDATAAGWSSIGRTFYGGVATLGRYVFATDQETGGGGAEKGLIRFDADNDYAPTRFATNSDFSDVTIGNDGLLYALNAGTTVSVFDPITLAPVRTITVPGSDNTAVAVDSQGNLYLGGFFDEKLWKLDPSGGIIKSIDVLPTDIDISADDQILMSGQGFVRLLDANLDEITSFEAGSFTGTTFVAFAEHQYPAALSGALGGRLFNDLDGDGIKDADEGALARRRVWLDLNASGAWDVGDVSTVTNGSGNYLFAAVPAGTYNLRQIVPEGWSPTKPFAKRIVTIVAQQSLGGQNFGSRQNVIISGFVYHDSNRSKVRDPLESPLARWQVYLDLDDDGVLDADETSVRTNNAGKFVFTTTPGTYTIRIVQQPGWFRTTQPSFLVALGAGEVAADRLFGEKRIIST